MNNRSFIVASKAANTGASEWLSWLSACFDLTAYEFAPHVQLCADSSEPGACFGVCISLSLSASHPSPTLHSVSLSKINIYKVFLKSSKYYSNSSTGNSNNSKDVMFVLVVVKVIVIVWQY